MLAADAARIDWCNLFTSVVLPTPVGPTTTMSGTSSGLPTRMRRSAKTDSKIGWEMTRSLNWARRSSIGPLVMTCSILFQLRNRRSLASAAKREAQVVQVRQQARYSTEDLDLLGKTRQGKSVRNSHALNSLFATRGPWPAGSEVPLQLA